MRFQTLSLAFVLYSASAFATDIPVHAGDNLQTKINSATCGDTLTLDVRAGGAVTWDGNFTLPAVMGCSSSPITIRSANHAMLPAGRVSPSDIANMAEVRTTGSNGSTDGVFTTAPNAAYWILDGLYLSDNAGTQSVQELLNLNDNTGSHITVTHCYFVQKENGSGAPYHRSVVRVADFEQDSFTFKWNYVDNIIGYDYSGTLNTTQALLCIAFCKNSDIEDNFIGAWYAGMFFGGGDSGPTQTATLTGATLSSATFSNTTGISPNNTVIRFGVPFVGVLTPGCVNGSCAGSITYVSGTVLTSADIYNSLPMNSATIQVGTGATPSDWLQLTAVSGGTYTTQWVGASTHPVAGTYTFTLWQTATVTSVAGSTVNYTPDPAMHDVLIHSGATTAAWRPLTDYTPSNITVKTNTFNVDPTFGAYVLTNNGSCPKGAFEIKNMDTMLYEGNTQTGYPGIYAFTAANQNGSAPWTVIRDITMRSNWVNIITGTSCNRQGFIVSDDGYLHTISPTLNIEISNNLFSPATVGDLGAFGIAQTVGNRGSISIFHNTHLSANVPNDYNSSYVGITELLSFTYRDNITNYLGYGQQCFAMVPCYPSGTFQKNAVIDPQGQNFGGTSTWGAGSILAPTNLTAFTSVGFTNYAGGDYSLAMSSPFKGAGTSGTDPGVNWTTLQQALNGSPVAPTINGCPTSPGTQGTPYSFTLTATGTAPFTWSIASGSLPTGLSLSGALISGTPSGSGTSTFGVGVTNSVGAGTNSPLSCNLTITPVSGRGGSAMSGNVRLGGNVVIH